jgi:hypothetical protein
VTDERERRDKAVCEYAARRLTIHRNGGEFVVDSYPDEVERSNEAVDLIGHDDIGTIIAEHTIVPSYVNQVHDNARLAQVFSGFEERFDHSLEGPGRYTLAIHTLGGHEFPRGRQQPVALDTLELWTRSQRLPDPNAWPRLSSFVEATPPDVPVPVSLYRARCSPEDDCALKVALLAPGNLQKLRIESTTRAFEMKCPKLEVARLPKSATLLVLESRDVVMNNPVVFAQATFAASQGRSDVSDVVVYVDSATSDREEAWMDYFIKDGARWSQAALDIPRPPPLNILRAGWWSVGPTASRFERWQ